MVRSLPQDSHTILISLPTRKTRKYTLFLEQGCGFFISRTSPTDICGIVCIVLTSEYSSCLIVYHNLAQLYRGFAKNSENRICIIKKTGYKLYVTGVLHIAQKDICELSKSPLSWLWAVHILKLSLDFD